MQISAETPRRDVTIADNTFKIPAPYAAGHVVTAGEAAALNQTLAENVRNNFASRVKAGLVGTPRIEASGDKPAKEAVPPNSTQEELQAEIDKYVTEYEFGVGSVRTTDPVDRELRTLVTEVIKTALSARGSATDRESVKTYVDKYLSDAKYAEKVAALRKQAEKIVKQRKATGDTEIDSLFE